MTGLWEPAPIAPYPDFGKAPWQTVIRKRRKLRADILRRKLRRRQARRAMMERFFSDNGACKLVAMALCAVALVSIDFLL